jgi:hypothetical protein
MNAKAAAATENKSWFFGLKAGFIISSWSCHLLDDTRQSSSTFQYAPHLLHQHPVFSMFTILAFLYAFPSLLSSSTNSSSTNLYKKISI